VGGGGGGGVYLRDTPEEEANASGGVSPSKTHVENERCVTQYVRGGKMVRAQARVTGREREGAREVEGKSERECVRENARAREVASERESESKSTENGRYGVATIIRLLKMIGLSCKRAL